MNSSTLSLNSELDEGGWSTPSPGRFTPGEELLPIIQGTGWATGPPLSCVKYFAFTVIRCSDRPVRSESLYLLSGPDHREV
jgi:hypothetical protein